MLFTPFGNPSLALSWQPVYSMDGGFSFKTAGATERLQEDCDRTQETYSIRRSHTSTVPRSPRVMRTSSSRYSS